MSSTHMLVGFLVLVGFIVLFAVAKAIGVLKVARNTREAQTCPRCGGTQFEDEVLETLESSWSLYRGESRDRAVRVCVECAHRWQVERTRITKRYPDSWT